MNSNILPLITRRFILFGINIFFIWHVFFNYIILVGFHKPIIKEKIIIYCIQRQLVLVDFLLVNNRVIINGLKLRLYSESIKQPLFDKNWLNFSKTRFISPIFGWFIIGWIAPTKSRTWTVHAPNRFIGLKMNWKKKIIDRGQIRFNTSFLVIPLVRLRLSFWHEVSYLGKRKNFGFQ